ncbi:MAG: helix-turn-helix domain-containing protein [Gammaproteobacteria bacterium]|nr:helix-turn-helix domain-containing protein [Gammaproteobacteria bacterium]MBK80495.1 helix-turn-helix domain-containing protein [Gammaproteobacteria bacterium]|tara:strand:+ start:9477 stop:10712 length:1236 start_codon:yes stop_codon:yes gene_type:complete
MAQDDSEIRPETYALDALIRETLARGRRGGGNAADALLFLGNRHHAFPVVVVHDPILEPVDKLVWMVICQAAQATGTKAVFPSYTDIARLANVSSTSTVSRAISILRATRWLSLCARNREANGRFGGNVYALHDEPLPLADALHLDPGYMAFLDEAAGHHHARVRRVVQAVSTSLDQDIRSGKDVLAPVNPMERRLEALHAIQRGGDRRYFSFNAEVIAGLANSGVRRDGSNQDQNSKAVKRDPRKSKSVLRSSSKYINTTTTTPTDSKDSAREAVSLESLIVPPRLKDNQRALAARYLETIPVEHRQPVLDELAGRFLAEQHGAKPVYDELRYLHHLCVQVNRGGFVPNLGLKVQAERDRRRHEAERMREEAAERERERKERAERPPGENPIAEIRKLLGMPASPERKSR